MRLYRILGAGWAGTQADARAASKEAGRPWHEYEVPTDKPGLLAFLDERNVPAKPDESRELEQRTVPLERDPMDPPAPAADPPVDRRRFTADAIVDFILEDASVAQVESVLSALGARVGELAKAVRK